MKKGSHCSEELKQRMSLAKLGNKWNTGKHHSRESILKMSIAKKGKSFSKEHRENLRKSHIGHKPTAETKRKMGLSHKGEKHWNWQGGKNPEMATRLQSKSWEETRKRVYARDNWHCHICGKHCQRKDVQCHHIVPYRVTQDDTDDNLITLCRSCHRREEWAYYKKLKGQIELDFTK